VAAARRLLIDGLLGQARALQQLNKPEDFLRCVMEILRLVDAEKTKGLYAEQIQDLLSQVVVERSA
jgi:hypothetical protein